MTAFISEQALASTSTASRMNFVDDLALATAVKQIGEGEFQMHVPSGWRQGRGAFGGLVLGALTRSLEACEPEKERVLRSLTAQLSAPLLAGDATVRVCALRRGSSVTTLTALVEQEGQTLANATGVFGRARSSSPRAHSHPVERFPDYRTVIPVSLPVPPAPEFTQFFEFRPTGPLPLSGASEPYVSGWVRPKRCSRSFEAPEFIALADAWWPAAFSTETMPCPIATVAFALEYFPPLHALSAEKPLFHRARSVAARDGYVVEFRELFAESGELIALNQQTIAWI